MNSVLVVIVVALANVIGAAMAVPQALQLRKTRNTAGISAPWAAMSAAINLWWIIYGVGVRDWSIVPVGVVSVIAYLSIAVGLVRYGDRAAMVRGLLLGSTVALIPIPVLLSFGWAATGVSLGVLYAVQLSPAVIAVYRSHDVTGVSVSTWTMAFVEAALWGAYALPIRDVGLLALAATGLTMSFLVLARLFIVRPRRIGATEFSLAR